MPTMCSNFQRCNDFLFSHVNCQINIRPRRPRPSRIRSPNLPPPGFRLPRAMKIALSNTNMPICGQKSNLGWKQRNLNWLLGRLKWFHVLTYHGVLSQKNDQKSSNLAIWANCFHHNNSLMWHDHSTSFDLQIAYIQIDGCCEYKYVAIFESGTNERLISRLQKALHECWSPNGSLKVWNWMMAPGRETFGVPRPPKHLLENIQKIDQSSGCSQYINIQWTKEKNINKKIRYINKWKFKTNEEGEGENNPLECSLGFIRFKVHES